MREKFWPHMDVTNLSSNQSYEWSFWKSRFCYKQQRAPQMCHLNTQMAKTVGRNLATLNAVQVSLGSSVNLYIWKFAADVLKFLPPTWILSHQQFCLVCCLRFMAFIIYTSERACCTQAIARRWNTSASRYGACCVRHLFAEAAEVL